MRKKNKKKTVRLNKLNLIIKKKGDKIIKKQISKIKKITLKKLYLYLQQIPDYTHIKIAEVQITTHTYKQLEQC